MILLGRSLPAGFAAAAGTPPVNVEDSSPTTSTSRSTSTLSSALAPSATMAQFFPTTLVPIVIALALYILICHVLLPFIRKHQARYSQYLPLSATASAATAFSSRLPSAIRPSTIRANAVDGLTRVFLPSTWALRQAERRQEEGRRGSSDSSTSDEHILMTDESGEALVNFDYSNNTGTIHDQNRRRRDAMERQVARGLQAAREMGMGMGESDSDIEQQHLTAAATLGHVPAQIGTTLTSVPPEQRLSRHLEEGFRDDSDDGEGQGDEDGDNAVTLGRGRQQPLFTAR
ncbi:hypothetical protein DV738_g951, partial [Chaetothyriales sp. CBS 135597]